MKFRSIKKRRLVTISVLILAGCLIAAPTMAQVFQEYAYEENRIYPVRTGLGITTQIELSPHEQVLDYSTGFSSGWDLSRRENVFYLKPRNVDVDTNLMIRTATHSYVFELKVVATDWTALEQAKQAGVQYKITFAYPNNAEFKPKTEETRQLATTLEKDRNYNFDYDYSARTKQAWLVPTAVYDDGQFTYVRMKDLKQAPTGNFPAIFARKQERSEDFLVNTTVENNTLVVHGTYPYLVIRHGDNVVGLRRNTKK